MNVAGVSGWHSVSTGNTGRSFAITDTGALYAWGRGKYGVLGLGDTNDRNRPTKVNVAGVNGWHSVSTESSHTLAITDTGVLYAWGYNENGQLGLGDTNDRNTPTKVNVAGVNSWHSVSAGNDGRSFAITDTGALYAWGRGEYGVLGLGDTNDRNRPTKVNVAGVNSWHSVSAGNNFHVFAITRDKRLYAWGRELRGELGLGAFERPRYKLSPQPVKNVDNVSGWNSVQASSWHFSLAITMDGSLYAWGQSYYTYEELLPPAVGKFKNRDRDIPTLVPMSFFSD